MIEICVPCIKIDINPTKNVSTLKSIVYVEQNSNIGNLIDEQYNKKNCRPNLVKELGNDDHTTATDRFNLDKHNQQMAELETAELILPPEIDFND